MDEAGFRKSFGQAVKAAREAQGLTQRELAERADLADKYLSRIEVGAATPSIFVAAKLTRALGLSLESLTGAEPSAAGPMLAEVMALLARQPLAEIDRALRVLRELLR
ncbi:MAG: helix-turn-helix transcriptional regulator [Deltaproteobacteria bacterium]|nr:helix-turn-helix transcriptional regulator [Deltaproteobacteria bacterium]